MMMATFEYYHRQLGRATMAVLYIALAFLGLTVMCALLGLSHAVVSFRGVSAALGCVFGGMLAVFLLTSLVWSLVRFLDRRSCKG
jgi:hypothetical protein